MSPIEAIVIFFLVLFIARPITVLFHEFGHGIPALLLTGGKVTLYIGSYGDPEKSVHLKLGRLEIYFRYNPFTWNLGLCYHHAKDTSIVRRLIILFGGPVTSLVLGVASLYLAIVGNFVGWLVFFFVLLTGSFLLDFYYNIVPRKEPIQLHDGTTTYNDGQQIRLLLPFLGYKTEFFMGLDLYNAKQYEDAAKVFRKLLDDGASKKRYYEMAIWSYVMLKDFDSAIRLHEQEETLRKLPADRYAVTGYYRTVMDGGTAGLADYNRALKMEPDNPTALNNRGYTYNLLEEYDKAIADFDQVLATDDRRAYPLSNRGLAKMKSGRATEGLEDIKKSIELDDQNGYAFRNLGIYYFDRRKYAEALPYFKMAFELEPTTHLLEDYLEKTKANVDKSSEDY